MVRTAVCVLHSNNLSGSRLEAAYAFGQLYRAPECFYLLAWATEPAYGLCTRFLRINASLFMLLRGVNELTDPRSAFPPTCRRDSTGGKALRWVQIGKF